MYKGYESYRHYLNAKLHALSVKICGSREVLDEEISRIVMNRSMDPVPGVIVPPPSTKHLTDIEARDLYHKLLETCRSVQDNLKKSRQLTGNDDSMTPGQRKAIIKITKYDFKWSPEAAFSFIIGLFPEKRKRMSPWEIQNSKLDRLYGLLSKKDADRVIKRLDKIKKRNSKQ